MEFSIQFSDLFWDHQGAQGTLDLSLKHTHAHTQTHTHTHTYLMRDTVYEDLYEPPGSRPMGRQLAQLERDELAVQTHTQKHSEADRRSGPRGTTH